MCNLILFSVHKFIYIFEQYFDSFKNKIFFIFGQMGMIIKFLYGYKIVSKFRLIYDCFTFRYLDCCIITSCVCENSKWITVP